MARVKKSRPGPPACPHPNPLPEGEGTAPAVWIVGCGPGAIEYLTKAARQAVARAGVLVGSRRLLEMFPDHRGKKIAVDGRMAAAPARLPPWPGMARMVAVLVSGDPGLFSLAGKVVERSGGNIARWCRASAPCRWPLPGWGWIGPTPGFSAPTGGRPTWLLKNWPLGKDGHAGRQPGGRCLGGGGRRAPAATHAAWLCEDLTLSTERVRRMTPGSLARPMPSSLAIVLLIRGRL